MKMTDEQVLCPNCHSRLVGKLGSEGRYFCRNCYVEFVLQDERAEIFSIAEDGSLSAVKEEYGGDS